MSLTNAKVVSISDVLGPAIHPEEGKNDDAQTFRKSIIRYQSHYSGSLSDCNHYKCNSAALGLRVELLSRKD